MGSEFVTRQLRPGLAVHALETENFKTTTVHVYLHQPLRAETATANALLSQVLPRGCEGFPTTLEIARHLQRLYGAELGADIVKKGERQLLQFTLDLPADRFLPGEGNLFRRGLDVLAAVITRPVREGGLLRRAYVEQERENLRRRIEGLINDKRAYAVARCFQEMCRNEPFGVYKYGRVEDLGALDAEALTRRYEEVLRTSPIDVFVVGAMRPDEAAEAVLNALAIPDHAPVQPPATLVARPVEAVHQVEERQDVNQGKLSLGLRTQTGRGDPDYDALLVANSILGGGAHGKLFQNVREKASLAYYAFSQLESHKGVMVISSGIEFAKYEQALAIIQEQLADLRAGQITEQEWSASLNSLTLDLRTSDDRPGAKIGLHLDGLIAGRPQTTAERLESLRAVTREDAVAAARKVELDTIYFLNKKE